MDLAFATARRDGRRPRHRQRPRRRPLRRGRARRRRGGRLAHAARRRGRRAAGRAPGPHGAPRAAVRRVDRVVVAARPDRRGRGAAVRRDADRLQVDRPRRRACATATRRRSATASTPRASATRTASPPRCSSPSWPRSSRSRAGRSRPARRPRRRARAARHRPALRPGRGPDASSRTRCAALREQPPTELAGLRGRHGRGPAEGTAGCRRRTACATPGRRLRPASSSARAAPSPSSSATWRSWCRSRTRASSRPRASGPRRCSPGSSGIWPRPRASDRSGGCPHDPYDRRHARPRPSARMNLVGVGAARYRSLGPCGRGWPGSAYRVPGAALCPPPRPFGPPSPPPAGHRPRRR